MQGKNVILRLICTAHCDEMSNDNAASVRRGKQISVKFVIFLGDEELSSDEDDEKLIYTEELSPSDVHMFGTAYAEFKKKALKEINGVDEINSNSEEDNNISGNASDSDDDIDRRFEQYFSCFDSFSSHSESFKL